MQTLNDDVQAIKQKNNAEKERVQSIALEVENPSIRLFQLPLLLFELNTSNGS
jgi:hypothetical protein